MAFELSQEIRDRFSLPLVFMGEKKLRDIINDELELYIPDLVEDALEAPSGTFQTVTREQTLLLKGIDQTTKDIKADTTYIREHLTDSKKKSDDDTTGDAIKHFFGGMGLGAALRNPYVMAGIGAAVIGAVGVWAGFKYGPGIVDTIKRGSGKIVDRATTFFEREFLGRKATSTADAWNDQSSYSGMSASDRRAFLEKIDRANTMRTEQEAREQALAEARSRRAGASMLSGSAGRPSSPVGSLTDPRASAAPTEYLPPQPLPQVTISQLAAPTDLRNAPPSIIPNGSAVRLLGEFLPVNLQGQWAKVIGFREGPNGQETYDVKLLFSEDLSTYNIDRLDIVEVKILTESELNDFIESMSGRRGSGAWEGGRPPASPIAYTPDSETPSSSGIRTLGDVSYSPWGNPWSQNYGQTRPGGAPSRSLPTYSGSGTGPGITRVPGPSRGGESSSAGSYTPSYRQSAPGTQSVGLGGVVDNTGTIDSGDSRQLQVYNAYIKAGLSPKQAMALTAEIGRENDYRDQFLFGTHTDPHNGSKNGGMMSWQGSRYTNLYNFMKTQGLLDSNGNIIPGQASLDAMARFSIDEIRKSYPKTAEQFLGNPDIGRDEAARVLGTDYVRWRYNDPAYRSHHDKRNKYYGQVQAAAVHGQNSVSVTSGDFIDRVNENQARVAGIRKQPLDPKLHDTLNLAANAASNETGRNLSFEVFSGGQPTNGVEGVTRTGSHEHNEGGAGDFRIFETMADGTRRPLDITNKNDMAAIEAATRNFAMFGGRSVGAGYMGEGDWKNQALHFGISRNNPAAYSGPEWIRNAFATGRNQFLAPGFNPQAAAEQMFQSRAILNGPNTADRSNIDETERVRVLMERRLAAMEAEMGQLSALAAKPPPSSPSEPPKQPVANATPPPPSVGTSAAQKAVIKEASTGQPYDDSLTYNLQASNAYF